MDTYARADDILHALLPGLEFTEEFGGQLTLAAMIAVKVSRGLKKEDSNMDLVNFTAMYLAARRVHDAENTPLPEHKSIPEAGA